MFVPFYALQCDSPHFFIWLYLSIINPVLIFCQPHSPDNHALARETKDIKIDRVYIGSCTGGKTEDFMAAAKVFLASVSCFIS